ncbi:glycosyltransferase family 39 protein [Chloroflexota bacterium]|nr:glycosyltransferase family 39 protein [Chloroflexota bacterium]
MLVLSLLPVIGILLFWIYSASIQTSEEPSDFIWQESLIRSALIWSAWLVIGTEILSLISEITSLGVIVFWALTILVLLIFLWKTGRFAFGWYQIINSIRLPKKIFGWISLVLIIIILIILFITGILSPPTIHDVFTYHMSRVMHWIQNRTLDYFPTSITWQLWMPPFSEMIQLNFYLLTGNDVMSFYNQWQSLVLALVAVSAAAGQFGAKKNGQWISAIFILTMPIVVLQASGAKNDLVLAFIFSAVAYYIIKATHENLGVWDKISLSIAVGLGLLTKGNFPFFVLPVLIWLLIIFIKKKNWKDILVFIGIGILAVGSLNAGQWLRNFNAFGDPLNSSAADFTLNQRFGLDVVISNLSRNIVTQMISIGFVNEIMMKALTTIHNMMGISVFDQTITNGPGEFFIVPTREEVAANPIHFLVTCFVVLVLLISLFKKKNCSKDRKVLYLCIAAFLGMVIFSAIFRWQVWGTRYFIPYYVLFAPAVGYIFSRCLPRWMGWLVCAALLAWLINPLLNNHSRSFSWSESNRNSIWTMSRKGLLFANHQAYEGAILEMTYEMYTSGCREYGMVLGKNVPEYLFWATLTPDASEYRLEHYAVDNVTASLESPDFEPCGIIVLDASSPEIVEDGSYSLKDEWYFESDGERHLILYLLPEYIPQTTE